VNIFALDSNPVKAAIQHSDYHVISQLKEGVQIMCTVVHLLGCGTPNLCAPTHPDHPSVRWALVRADNFHWLYQLVFALNSEYRMRYGKTKDHNSMWQADEASAIYEKQIGWREGMTAWPQVMPAAFQRPIGNEVTARHVGDAHPSVQAYRAYYATDKRTLRGKPVSWTGRSTPSWFENQNADLSAAFETTAEAVAGW